MRKGRTRRSRSNSRKRRRITRKQRGGLFGPNRNLIEQQEKEAKKRRDEEWARQKAREENLRANFTSDTGCYNKCVDEHGGEHEISGDDETWCRNRCLVKF
jgi:hypothetical protein